MKFYYLDSQNKTSGPVGWETLQELIKSGVLKGDPMAVPEGGSEWRPLSTLAGQNAANPSPAGAAVPNQASIAADKALAASKDALAAFKMFATNPVGGLAAAYESLGSSRALGVGISFGTVFALCALFGTYRLIPAGLLPPGAGTFFKLLVCALVPFACLAGAGALARLVFRGRGGLSNDSFIAGASLLPFGFVMLLASILGAGNIEVIGVLTVFALCLTIMMLFAGCTRISKVSERLATIAVPVMLLLSAWFTKIIYTAMIHSAMGSSMDSTNPLLQ